MRKAQVWYMDFIISFFIFSIVIVIFLHFIVNKSEETKFVQDQLLVEARIISNSLMLPGYPNNWDSTNVERIGITNSNSKFNRTKLLQLGGITYKKARELFDVTKDFTVYFEDENGKPVPVMGVCSFGHPAMNLSKPRKVAFVHDEVEGSKSYMYEILQGFDFGTYCIPCMAPKDISSLNTDIDSYDLLVVEDAKIVQESDVLNVRRWIEKGHDALLIQEYATSLVFGMNLDHTAYNGDVNGKVTREMPLLDYSVGTAMQFNDDATFYIGSNEDEIIDLDSYFVTSTGKDVIHSWNMSNGTVYHFALLNVTEPPGFEIEMTKAVQDLMVSDCKSLDLSLIDYHNIVRLSRLLVDKDRVIRMVILVWE